jgi:hypothetical protein
VLLYVVFALQVRFVHELLCALQPGTPLMALHGKVCESHFCTVPSDVLKEHSQEQSLGNHSYKELSLIQETFAPAKNCTCSFVLCVPASNCAAALMPYKPFNAVLSYSAL